MPNNNTVASAYVQIVPSAQGIKGSITSALGGEADSAGSKLGSMLSTGIKAAVAAGVAGLGAIVGGALTEGGALQQSIGGVETLFGDSASRVISAAENAYRTAGVSANSYMEQVTSFSATLLQGLGGDTEAAAGYADKAIVQMADNANKMGTSMESIQYAYQGFAKDNYTMLDNLKLGYGGTQSEMARLINDSGVLGDSVKVTAETVKDVPFSSIIDAIQVIQDNLGITGTTAKEAATTLTGSFASVKAALSNVLAGLALGQDLGPALNGLASTLATFLTGNLIPAIYNILSALPSALVTFITALGPQLASGLSTIVPQIMTTGAQMLQSLSAGLVQGIPNFLAQALPLLLQFTTSLRANFSNIVDAGIDLLLNLVQGIANGLPSLIEYVPTIVSNIAGLINDNAPKILQAGLQILVTLGQGILQATPTLIANIPQIIQAIVDVFTAFNWVNLGSNIITMLKNGITSMVGAVQSAGTSVFNAVKNAITNLPSTLQGIGSNAIQNLAGGMQALLYDAQMAGVSVFSVVQTALAQLPSTLLSLGKNAVSNLASGLSSMLSNVVSAAQSILTGIVGAIQALPSRLLSLATDAVRRLWNAFIVKDWNGLGTNIIQGIINGIGSMAGALWDAATNIAKTALDAIKGFFGIASPSKLMQFEIGPYIPQGLAIGIEKNAGYVTDAMDFLGGSMRQTLPLDADGQAARALQQDAQFRREPRPAHQGRGGQAITLDEMTGLVTLIIQAIRENGGPIIIGDEIIGRANDRYRQDRAIMTGGTA